MACRLMATMLRRTSREGQLAELADRLFPLQSRNRIVVPKVPESEKPTEARHQAHDIIIEPLLLRGAAEVLAQAHGDDGCGTSRVAMMQEKCSGGKAHDPKHAVQRLRKHALNLSAHKTRRRQIEIG